MLPNRYAEAVGPFVFLDYIPLFVRAANDPVKKRGTHPHAHRGIATLTYVLSGEAEHYDSQGHHAIVHSGGVQWMKAGSGIIHEEGFGMDTEMDDRTTHGFQFWINLPAKVKAEEPEYLAVQASEVPQRMLDDNAGWLKVIVGEYDGIASKIPNYSRQFLYHIHLEPQQRFVITAIEGDEYGAFTVGPRMMLNDTVLDAAEFIELDRSAGTIELINNSDVPNDVLLFGGERYTEPIVADGPFVMNTHQEIAQAYLDLHDGKYGTISKG